MKRLVVNLCFTSLKLLSWYVTRIERLFFRPWNKDFRARCNSDLILQEAVPGLCFYTVLWQTQAQWAALLVQWAALWMQICTFAPAISRPVLFSPCLHPLCIQLVIQVWTSANTRSKKTYKHSISTTNPMWYHYRSLGEMKYIHTLWLLIEGFHPTIHIPIHTDQHGTLLHTWEYRNAQMPNFYLQFPEMF